jgi:hypothetical protein
VALLPRERMAAMTCERFFFVKTSGIGLCQKASTGSKRLEVWAGVVRRVNGDAPDAPCVIRQQGFEHVEVTCAGFVMRAARISRHWVRTLVPRIRKEIHPTGCESCARARSQRVPRGRSQQSS